jgi:hypothetical protein
VGLFLKFIEFISSVVRAKNELKALECKDFVEGATGLIRRRQVMRGDLADGATGVIAARATV